MAATLDIREQPRLALRRQIEICADGIHHRLFRSLLTLTVITLAVAFVTNVLAEGVVVRALKAGIGERASAVRLLGSTAAFLDGPIRPRELRHRVTAAPAGSWQAATLAHWLEMSPAQLEKLAADFRRADTYLAWLDGLNIAHRRMLVGRRDNREALQWLNNREAAAQFEQALEQIPTLALPDGMLGFVPAMLALEEQLDVLTQRFNKQAEAMESALGEAALGEQLRRGAAQPLLTAHGIELPQTVHTQLTEQAQQQPIEQELLGLLDQPTVIHAWRGAFGELPGRDTAIDELARSTGVARWLADQPDVSLSASTIHSAAKRLRHVRRLTAVESRLYAEYGDHQGAGSNTFWLIVVSSLVCIVGIANAMLVSVLERFREIATMKCLGALDGFIATLFLLEASLLGLLGGMAGVLLGLLVGVGRMWLGYGNWVFVVMPWDELLAAAGLAVLGGLGLATLASIYPAIMAGRMPPLEAMRVE